MRFGIWNVASFGATAVAYLICQRLSLATTSATIFGAWATLYATALFYRTLDLNIATAIIKFGANRYARRQGAQARNVCATGLAAAFVLCGFASVLFYLTAGLWVRLYKVGDVLAGTHCAGLLAVFIFIYGLAISSQATLEAQLAYRKIAVIRMSSALCAIAATVVATRFGSEDALTIGLIAQASINACAFLISSGLELADFQRVTLLVAKRLLRFAARVQYSQLLMPAVDPFVKYCLSRFATLEAVAVYEVVNRLLLQVRQVVVALSQTELPLLLHSARDANVQRDPRTASIKALATAAIFAGILVVSQPLAAFVLKLSASPVAILPIALALTLGWWINACSITAYFVNVAKGLIHRNHANQKLLAVTLGVGVPLGGLLLGGFGVAIGVAIALACSGIALVLEPGVAVVNRLRAAGVYTKDVVVMWCIAALGASAQAFLLPRTLPVMALAAVPVLGVFGSRLFFVYSRCSAA